MSSSKPRVRKAQQQSEPRKRTCSGAQENYDSYTVEELYHALHDPAAKASRKKLKAYIARVYRSLRKCVECKCVLSYDELYYTRNDFSIPANAALLCRGCYLCNHKTQEYFSNGPEFYYTLKWIGAKVVRMRIDFNYIPTRDELHAEILKHCPDESRSWSIMSLNAWVADAPGVKMPGTGYLGPVTLNPK